MDKRCLRKRAPVVCLAALLSVIGLLVSGCVVKVPVDVQATAQILARTWATQTAEAQPATTQPAPSPTNTGMPTAAPTVTTGTPAPTDTTGPTQVAATTSTVTLAPSPTATTVQTVTPKATATATQKATPKPTATRTSTPSLTPPCTVPVDAALVSGWDYAKLGCAKAAATVPWAAWQPFQHGEMIWMEDTDWVYALNHGGGTDSKQGDWATGGNSWRWDDSFPDGHGLTPPEGLVEPIRGFGFVWYTKLGGQSSQLGWGTAQEMGFCALVQRFDKGMLVQSSAAPGCAGGQFNWAANPAFSPVFIALYGDGSWKRF
jgi:hypothetical protein